MEKFKFNGVLSENVLSEVAKIKVFVFNEKISTYTHKNGDVDVLTNRYYHVLYPESSCSYKKEAFFIEEIGRTGMCQLQGEVFSVPEKETEKEITFFELPARLKCEILQNCFHVDMITATIFAYKAEKVFSLLKEKHPEFFKKFTALDPVGDCYFSIRETFHSTDIWKSFSVLSDHTCIVNDEWLIDLNDDYVIRNIKHYSRCKTVL